jgi:gluconokinase
MPDNLYLLAVDIGTSSTKAVLFDQSLQVISIASREYPIYNPHRGWSEQNPEEIVNAVIQAIRLILHDLPARNKLLALSFSSQQYSILAVDSKGKPLTSSLTWSDTRSKEVASRYQKHPDAEQVYARTGCPIDAIYPLSKIGWLQEQHNFDAGVRFISIKEYVIHQITGQYIVDWATASATGLFDIHQKKWDLTSLGLLGISSDNLSEVVSPRTLLTKVKKDFLTATYLPVETQLVIGGGDGPLANIGVGATSPDILAINVGTSAAARCAVPKAEIDPQGRLWTYVVDEGLWVLGGIVSSGGIVYKWWLDNTVPDKMDKEYFQTITMDVEAIEQEVATTLPGAEGLIFIPYLGGEQCPVWQPDTRGSFFGLDFRHQKGHLTRAVLEGITRSIYRISEQIQFVLRHPFNEIRVTGGLSQSSTWLQIAADMFGLPVSVPKSSEGSAKGAAIIGGLALGLWSSLDQLNDHFDIKYKINPRDEMHELYQSQYEVFLDVLDFCRNISTKWRNKDD